jgi:hypothetical protein
LKHLRKRLTYSNVMSSVAVFLVLGGATAFAAGQLAKNSVGKKQLKNGAVTTAKLKKNAVTGTKIKNNAVTGAKVKDGSLTGSDINLGTLGTVPSASNANKAASATKTDQIAKIFFATQEGGPKQTILDFNGLTFTARCEGEFEVEATTSVAHSYIDFYTPQDQDTATDTDFNPGETFDADDNHGSGTAIDVYSLNYSRPDGVNVMVELREIPGFTGPVFPGTPQESKCLLSGYAIAG